MTLESARFDRLSMTAPPGTQSNEAREKAARWDMSEVSWADSEYQLGKVYFQKPEDMLDSRHHREMW